MEEKVSENVRVWLSTASCAFLIGMQVTPVLISRGRKWFRRHVRCPLQRGPALSLLLHLHDYCRSYSSASLQSRSLAVWESDDLASNSSVGISFTVFPYPPPPPLLPVVAVYLGRPTKQQQRRTRNRRNSGSNNGNEVAAVKVEVVAAAATAYS